MKKSKLISLVLSILCVCILFAGCGCAAHKQAENCDNGSSFAAKYPGDRAAGHALDAPEHSLQKSERAPASVPEVFSNRKLIKNADLTVQTLEYDNFIASVTQKIEALGGYISSSSQSGRAIGSSDNPRRAFLTVRIPAEKLSEFLGTVGTLGNVTEQSESMEDITAAYVDTEAKLEALRAEREALLSMLEKAQKIEDIIVIQDRLNDVRYETESHERIKKTYDDQVAFSTVNMSIFEVERETPVGQETFSQEISRRFSESLSDLGRGLKKFFAWFLGNAPEIIFWLVLLAVIPLVIVLICVKHGKRKKQAAQQRQKTAQSNAAIQNPPQA